MQHEKKVQKLTMFAMLKSTHTEKHEKSRKIRKVQLNETTILCTIELKGKKELSKKRNP